MRLHRVSMAVLLGSLAFAAHPAAVRADDASTQGSRAAATLPMRLRAAMRPRMIRAAARTASARVRLQTSRLALRALGAHPTGTHATAASCAIVPDTVFQNVLESPHASDAQREQARRSLRIGKKTRAKNLRTAAAKSAAANDSVAADANAPPVPNAPADPNAPDDLTMDIHHAHGGTELGHVVRTVRWSAEGREDSGASGDVHADALVESVDKLQTLMKRLGFGGQALLRLGNAKADGRLVAVVHFDPDGGDNFDNAFRTEDMDDDGVGDDGMFVIGRGGIFLTFSRRDVHNHELGHGLVAHVLTPYGLNYYGNGRRQPGAINEHLADVIGVMTKHMRDDPSGERRGADLTEDDWMLGDSFADDAQRVGGGRASLRNFVRPGEAFEHPVLGRDQQMAHWSQRYRGKDDNGGVHLNSGPLNRAFALAVQRFGDQYIDTVGATWLHAARKLGPDARAEDLAHAIYTTASELFANDPAMAQRIQDAVHHGFNTVGFSDRMIRRGPALSRFQKAMQSQETAALKQLATTRT